MSLLSPLLPLSAGCIFFFATECPAQSITDVGVIPGGTMSSAEAVSADGSIVAVWASDPDSNNGNAYRWTLGDGLQAIGAPIGCSARDISGDGSTLIGNTADFRGFRWTTAEGFAYLPPAVLTTSCTNFDGSVIVGQTAFFPWDHALRWSTLDGAQDLGTLPGSEYAWATGVSDDGETVIGVSWSNGGYGFRHAFVWTAEVGMQDLGTLPGFDSADAENVSGDGSVIVGQSWPTAIGNVCHAVRWSRNGVEDLGLPAGYTMSSATATNVDGSVIVGLGWIISGDTVTSRVLIWSPFLGGPQDLQDYLTSLGIDMSGWQLEVATGVSADGHVLVGEGLLNGEQRGWVVRLSSPGACCVDFDGDGNSGTDADITAFFACLSGYCCPTCCSADFNGDGDVGTDADIDSFFRVLAGGNC